jgi:hypothetical protein
MPCGIGLVPGNPDDPDRADRYSIASENRSPLALGGEMLADT